MNDDMEKPGDGSGARDSATYHKRRLILFIPLAFLLGMVVLLFFGFTLNDPHQLPSALLGKELPEFALGTLENPEQRVSNADLKGRVALINVWATWCPTCAAEHAELLRIKRDSGLPIIGVVYKDEPAKARFWLAQRGNPYDFNLLDQDGRLGVNMGVYGAPESFLIDTRGVIVYKRVGEINRRVWREEIEPKLQQLGFKAPDARFPQTGSVDRAEEDAHALH